MSHPSSYESHTAHSATPEGFAVTDAVLRHVAAGALGCAFVGGWHSANITDF